VRLSIFGRLALGSLAIILVVAGVSAYALVQLRYLTTFNIELVSYHTPAIEQAKRLSANLDSQLASEKKYWALRDPVLRKDFEQDVEDFVRELAALRAVERSREGLQLLQKTERLHEAYRRLVKEQTTGAGGGPLQSDRKYIVRRDTLVDEVTDSLNAYAALHEDLMRQVVSESGVRAAQAESVMRELLIAAVLLGVGLAAAASYSILRPLRRVQDHIRQIGQGRFGTPVEVQAPSDLLELVETVNWMGQKLQELDAMKAEFLAHVSHELRTPLASIREGTHLLLDEIPGPLSQAQRETLQIMQDSSRRLIGLISTLLDLSKMEAGLMEYRILPTDLRRVVESSVQKVRLLAEGKGVRICVEHSEPALWGPMDGARIEQVVDNLLSNAVKFSPHGGSVTVRLTPRRKEGLIEVSVSDEGPGIPPADLPRVFDRFYQGRRSVGSPLAGSGLGLALAKKVVDAHAGRIWIESEQDKGTIVRFLLPLKGG
jgi:two-component system sensor histidine kinase GlrK